MKTYEERQKEELLFKVNGENEINKILNYAVPLLLEEFKSFEGTQILKQDFSLLKKIKDKTDLILNNVEDKFKNKDLTPSIYLNCSQYSIYLNIQLRFNNLREDGFLYYKGLKYLLNIENLKINSFYEFKEVESINEQEQYKTFLNSFYI